MVPEGVSKVVEEDSDGGGGGALRGREPGGGDGRGDREDHHARHAVQDGAQVAHAAINARQINSPTLFTICSLNSIN